MPRWRRPSSETGDSQDAVQVHLVPNLRSLVRDEAFKIGEADDFLELETRDQLAAGILAGLLSAVADNGIEVQSVLIRDIEVVPLPRDE